MSGIGEITFTSGLCTRRPDPPLFFLSATVGLGLTRVPSPLLLWCPSGRHKRGHVFQPQKTKIH